nr:MAG TPA: hypothetical protein [Caudoviricetes sp.]
MYYATLSDAVKDTNLKANHNPRPEFDRLCSAVKDTNLKANHNDQAKLMQQKEAVKDTNLKANHNCLPLLRFCNSLLKILI